MDTRYDYQDTDQDLALSVDDVVDDIDLGEPDEPLDEAAYRLWRKAVTFGTWNPADIDLSRDREQFLSLERPLQVYLEHFCGAFYNAEENVAKVFCPWVMSVSTTWQQAYLSTQLMEEFKHTDFFARYFKEVLGIEKPTRALSNPVHESLVDRAETLLTSYRSGSDDRTLHLVEAFTHYQGIIEGVQANAGYQIFLAVFASKGMLPGLAEGFRSIQRDEGRHVGFGMQLLRHYAHQNPLYAERIRAVYNEYLPLIQVRYGVPLTVNGEVFDPPAEERGRERLMKLYERRLKDIFS
ncbi:R2-like ligand-binding oxidase [Alicyclobacillus dauci]|uniref:R2-like ligand-binding oxidase n=1 Tax=Alicyclobacillus dauci TaxID=1475485 RepID=A0ABY6Z5H4_9BACL|nr:R2-like ligand-binding oxidase [Alicyclobacillus dauci]WAH38005.1 R2-like ligand-binding oxidase [Alicyclobacillus dauci]